MDTPAHHVAILDHPPRPNPEQGGHRGYLLERLWQYYFTGRMRADHPVSHRQVLKVRDIGHQASTNAVGTTTASASKATAFYPVLSTERKSGPMAVGNATLLLQPLGLGAEPEKPQCMRRRKRAEAKRAQKAAQTALLAPAAVPASEGPEPTPTPSPTPGENDCVCCHKVNAVFEHYCHAQEPMGDLDLDDFECAKEMGTEVTFVTEGTTKRFTEVKSCKCDCEKRLLELRSGCKMACTALPLTCPACASPPPPAAQPPPPPPAPLPVSECHALPGSCCESMLANLQKFCYSFKPEGNATKVPDPSHWDGGEWIAPASFDSLCDQYLPPSCATPGKATQCYRFLSFIARQYDPDICAAALSGQCEDVCDHQCPSPPPPSATALVASGFAGQPSGQGVKQALFCAGGSCYDRSTTAPLTAFNDDAAASADRAASMRKVAPGDAHGQRLLRRVPEQVGAAHAPDASTVPRVVALTTKDAGRFGPYEPLLNAHEASILQNVTDADGRVRLVDPDMQLRDASCHSFSSKSGDETESKWCDANCAVGYCPKYKCACSISKKALSEEAENGYRRANALRAQAERAMTAAKHLAAEQEAAIQRAEAARENAGLPPKHFGPEAPDGEDEPAASQEMATIGTTAVPNNANSLGSVRPEEEQAAAGKGASPLTSGTCSNQLSRAECDSLAVSLSATSQTSAQLTTCNSATCAPGGCYQYNDPSDDDHGAIIYNSDKTGDCTTTKQCLCGQPDSLSTDSPSVGSTDLEHIWSRPEDLEDAQDAVAENAVRKAEALRAQAFRAQAAATQAAAAERMAVERAAAEKAAAEKAALDAEAAVEVAEAKVAEMTGNAQDPVTNTTEAPKAEAARENADLPPKHFGPEAPDDEYGEEDPAANKTEMMEVAKEMLVKQAAKEAKVASKAAAKHKTRLKHHNMKQQKKHHQAQQKHHQEQQKHHQAQQHHHQAQQKHHQMKQKHHQMQQKAAAAHEDDFQSRMAKAVTETGGTGGAVAREATHEPAPAQETAATAEPTSTVQVAGTASTSKQGAKHGASRHADKRKSFHDRWGEALSEEADGWLTEVARANETAPAPQLPKTAEALTKTVNLDSTASGSSGEEQMSDSKTHKIEKRETFQRSWAKATAEMGGSKRGAAAKAAEVATKAASSTQSHAITNLDRKASGPSGEEMATLASSAPGDDKIENREKFQRSWAKAAAEMGAKRGAARTPAATNTKPPIDKVKSGHNELRHGDVPWNAPNPQAERVSRKVAILQKDLIKAKKQAEADKDFEYAKHLEKMEKELASTMAAKAQTSAEVRLQRSVKESVKVALGSKAHEAHKIENRETFQRSWARAAEEMATKGEELTTKAEAAAKPAQNPPDTAEAEEAPKAAAGPAKAAATGPVAMSRTATDAKTKEATATEEAEAAKLRHDLAALWRDGGKHKHGLRRTQQRHHLETFQQRWAKAASEAAAEKEADRGAALKTEAPPKPAPAPAPRPSQRAQTSGRAVERGPHTSPEAGPAAPESSAEPNKEEAARTALNDWNAYRDERRKTFQQRWEKAAGEEENATGQHLIKGSEANLVAEATQNTDEGGATAQERSEAPGAEQTVQAGEAVQSQAWKRSSEEAEQHVVQEEEAVQEAQVPVRTLLEPADVSNKMQNPATTGQASLGQRAAQALQGQQAVQALEDAMQEQAAEPDQESHGSVQEAGIVQEAEAPMRTLQEAADASAQAADVSRRSPSEQATPLEVKGQQAAQALEAIKVRSPFQSLPWLDEADFQGQATEAMQELPSSRSDLPSRPELAAVEAVEPEATKQQRLKMAKRSLQHKWQKATREAADARSAGL